MTTLQAPDYLIEWGDGILGGFTDPTWALIAIAENRGIRDVIKIWRRNGTAMQLYYAPVTEGELRFARPDVAQAPWETPDTADTQEFVREG